MASFTCITCHVAFPSFDIQREHYKTDWHRYNLKRKVAEMPPVTLQDFHVRFLSVTTPQQDSVPPDQHFSCQHCRKQFTNKNSYENHLKSKRHHEAVERSAAAAGDSAEKRNNSKNTKPAETRLPFSASGPRSTNRRNSVEDQVVDADDAEWEDVDDEEGGDDDDDGAEIHEANCLFCSQSSSSLEENVKHMTVEHSFFIPDIEYLIDLEGFVFYLAAKVNTAKLCLWCNEQGKSFHTGQAVQQHMLNKGHCKILFEGDALAEYADYYDYTPSYPDGAEGSTDPNEEIGVDLLEGDDMQLVLPSGATIGHRSLMKYYKQNIPPRRQGAVSKSQRMVQNVLSHYRAIGYSAATSSDMIARRARDVKYLQATKTKRELQLGMRNNKLQRTIRLQYKLQ